MPVLERMRRKLSRSKSAAIPAQQADDETQNNVDETEIVPQAWTTKKLSLTPSDEQLVSRLAFTEDTEFIERPPKYQTPSVATAYSERTIFNNVERGLLSLPTELLIFLQPYLSLSSEVALRHSCSRFLHLYSTQSFLLTGQELFDFLCVSCPSK